MKVLPVEVLNETILEQGIKTVLFIDTCIFLDIIRSPIRNSIRNNEVASAISLLELMEKPDPEIFIVINETIKDEWEKNIENTLIDLKREISKISVSYKNIIDVYSYITPNTKLNFSNLRNIDLSAPLESLSNSFLEKAYVIKREDRHSVDAMKRVFENVLPAQKGKSEPKDCEIFESFLNLSKNLRGSSYNGNILFITSNHSDYGKPNVISSLSKELETINSQLINSLSWGLEISKNA